MEGFGVAASVFAVVQVADQIAERIKRLYEFWSAVNEAPEKIQAIANDLKLLSSVIVQISNNCHNVAQDKNYGLDSLTVNVLKACKLLYSMMAMYR
jgi:predicted PurR-regulated permease PerM